MYRLIRELLFLLPPERAHYFSLQVASLLVKIGLLRRDKELNRWYEIGGMRFPNRVGIGAGMDKNADFLEVWYSLGAGFIEVGTVTPKPQEGNPKPRLFRLTKDKAILNRMGFNNKGAEYVYRKLVEFRSKGYEDFVVGVSIGKNKDTPNNLAHRDYEFLAEKMKEVASFLVVNVSSPNTEGLRDLQVKESLELILTGVKEKAPEIPLWIKISPDEYEQVFEFLPELYQKGLFQFVVLTNTTVRKDILEHSRSQAEKYGRGGISGKPLFPIVLSIIKEFRERVSKEIPVVGVGGIFSCDDAKQMYEAGADLIEVFTGLVYEGPSLIKELVKCG